MPSVPIWETIQPYAWPLIVALLVTLAVTPLVRLVAVAGRIYDNPDAELKPHDKPIPYLGGVAIYVGWTCAIVVTIFTATLSEGSVKLLWYVLASGTIMMVTGLVDDLYDIRPRTKLLCQSVAAAVLILGGIGDDVLAMIVGGLGESIPGINMPDFLRTPPMWFKLGFASATALVVIFAAGNATNLIDGLDGLCSGVTGIIAIGFVVIATHLAADGFHRSGDPVRLIVACSLLGACLGFLKYNFNPAQIFMGDAGSLLLGLNAAVMLLLFAEGGVLRWFIGACMVFSLPVFDTTLAIARRWLNNKPIFKGDRSHFYDQLRDRGYSVRRTVLICYALAALLAAIGCVVIFIRTRYAALVFVLVIIAAILTVIRMGMLRIDKPKAN